VATKQFGKNKPATIKATPDHESSNNGPAATKTSAATSTGKSGNN